MITGIVAVHDLGRHERKSTLAALSRLHATAFRPAWSVDEIEQLLGHPGAVALAVTGHDRVLAFAIGRVAADEAEILSLVTTPGEQRKGYARQLLLALEPALAGRGATTVFLEVAEDNEPARTLYGAVGYAETGRRRGYYPRPQGRPCDALVLTKRVAGPSCT